MNSNVFTKYPDCIESRVKLKGLLSDVYPGERIKINLILNAYDEGIVDGIQHENELSPVVFGRWKKILVETYGISESNAEWSVNFWFSEYGVGALGKSYRPNRPADKKPSGTSVPFPKQNEPQSSLNGCLKLEDIDNGEKIPKSLMRIVLLQETNAFISSLNCVIRKDFTSKRTGETCLKVTGEYAGKTDEHLLIMIMIYNAENTMIGFTCGEQIRKGFNGEAAFEDSVKVPSDERISRIVIRTALEPF